ncbi:chemotaxis protein CheX [Eubacteriaceae bacterium ES3]|nr:chemotaxis protein CheX [Eubacteriaceae bacterium ES3]
MYNKYFGNYLLKKKIITPEQLKEVLNKQESSRVKLGVLAIESGLMNAQQVNKVHHLQAIKDMRFGDLAIEVGFLTKADLETLLTKQKESHILLGQILLDQGLLTFEKYEKLLLSYKEDSGFSEEEIQILKSSNTDDIVKMIMGNQEDTEMLVFEEYIELFVRNIIRFIDREMMIERPYTKDSYAYENLASQKIIGDYNIETGISAEEETAVEFASIYAEEAIDSMNDLVKDALGEFMNCQNGLFISNLYHKNIKCDLEAQTMDQEGELKALNKLLIVPCQLSFGKIEIVLNI